ncbi:MAG: VWA domain-containing protein, partial [candidate division KSB1 bacterium]|nr:VWA domain-containing protein [candidate division KSB1 bacterium]
MQLDLNFSTATGYPLLLLLLALVFTFFIYRVTTPAVAAWLRHTLAFLRALTLVAALLLLFEPTLSLAVRRIEKPAVAVLIDRSASMNLSDSLHTRAEAVRRALALPWLEQLRKRAEVFLFSFSDSLQSLPPESLAGLRFNGDGSNVAHALNEAKRRLSKHHYQAAILLSDGAYNLGSNPSRLAESYGLPIVTVRLGTPQRTRDALIQDVVTNEIAYAETRLPVEVTIAATGLAGRTTRLRIAEGDREVAVQEIKLPADQTQVTATLTLTPTTVGLNRYSVRLEAVEGELTTANNRRTFYVKVLKSKLKLWIFAGAPSADYTFFKRAVGSDPNFAVQGFVQRPGGSFYAIPEQPLPAFESETAWQPVDAVILIDFPRRDSNRALLDMLARQLAEKGKPLFYLHGPGVDLNAWWRLRPALPLAAMPNSMSEQVISLQFLAAGLSHPVTRPLTERFVQAAGGGTAARGSDELPPLFCNLYNVRPAAGVEALAGPDAGSRAEPLWLAH